MAHFDAEHIQPAQQPSQQAVPVVPAPAPPSVPPGHVIVPESMVNRPMMINDLPSPFQKGLSVEERLKRINDKLNAS